MYLLRAAFGSLYSVIDTERSVNRGLVIDYLKKHYTLVSADEASHYYTRCFLDRDEFMIENASLLIAYIVLRAILAFLGAWWHGGIIRASLLQKVL